MTFKSKLYKTISITEDYLGMHATARVYKDINHNNRIETIMLTLFLPLFPIMYIMFTVLGFKFHRPNCDCEQYKQLYDI